MCIRPGAMIQSDPERQAEFRRYEEAVAKDSRPKASDGSTIGFLDFVNDVGDLAERQILVGVWFLDAPCVAWSTLGAIVQSTEIGYMLRLPDSGKMLGPYGDGDASKAVSDLMGLSNR